MSETPAPSPDPQLRPALAGPRHYDVLGSRVRIDASSNEVAMRVDRLLGPFSTTEGDIGDDISFTVVHDPPSGVYELQRGGRLLVRTSYWQATANWLLGELNREALERFDGFAVHAGVVATGRLAIAFPASSGDGKSTLVAACLAVGFDYVSDEALCVEFDSGAVVPYGKPIQLSTTSRALLGLALDESDVDPSDDEASILPADLRSQLASPPLGLAHVVRLERRPGPEVLSEVPAADTCAWLLRFSFNHHKRPQASFDLTADLARRATAWRIEYEDAPGAALLLAERFGSGAASAGAPPD